jgi:nickel/cobalt transporter (NicO) family protein
VSAGWVLEKQALFYRALAGMIRSAKTDGFALWGLMGISFAYGIFHAAGPGHGKAVISSYLLANEETWRRGITLSFAAAVMQSLTAVIIVGVAAVLLGATAKLMGDTVRIIEVVSYGLIMLLGARLLWVKGRSFIAALHALKAEPEKSKAETHNHSQCKHAQARGHSGTHCDNHAPHHQDEPDILPWGHAHGPEPQELSGPGGWGRGLSAIVAVGMRPCSGAIIVLVFALAQGLFWARDCLDFRDGLRDRDHGRCDRDGCGRRQGARETRRQQANRLWRCVYTCHRVRCCGTGPCLRRSVTHWLHG